MTVRRRAEPDPDAQFRAFVTARWSALTRYAYLFTGDVGHAEDLVQHALEKTWSRWRRVRIDALEAYVRACVANAAAARGRTPRVRETPWDDAVHLAGTRASVATDEVCPAERSTLWLALADLPPRMRAVVVLRVWEDLSEQETARILGCAPGTVKSQLSRALERLRSSAAVHAVADRVTPSDQEGTVL